MSEQNSLFIQIKITEEKLQQFFRANPLPHVVDDNWLNWWNSRDMYQPRALEHIPVYEKNNRAVINDWLNNRRMGCTENYEPASQTWTFSSVFFSENYTEILPMLALLKDLATYQDAGQEGFALVYNFYWGSDAVMAYLDFSNGEALLRNNVDMLLINPAITETANRQIEAAAKALAKKFEN